MWEIIDHKGTIHSGSEEEMRIAFSVMTVSLPHTQELIDRYYCPWIGDLKLIEIHAVKSR